MRVSVAAVDGRPDIGTLLSTLTQLYTVLDRVCAGCSLFFNRVYSLLAGQDPRSM